MQNAKLLKSNSYFAKAFNATFFSRAVVINVSFSTWHMLLIIHKLINRNDALQNCRHQRSSWPPSATLLEHYSYLRVKASRLKWSTLRTLGVNTLPVLLTASFSSFTFEFSSWLFCPLLPTVPPICYLSLYYSKTHEPPAALVSMLYDLTVASCSASVGII